MKRKFIVALAVLAGLFAVPGVAQAVPPGPYPGNAVWHDDSGTSGTFLHVGNAELAAATETRAFYDYGPTWTFPIWDFGDVWGMGHQPSGTYWIGTGASVRVNNNKVQPVVEVYSPTLRRVCVYGNTVVVGSDANHHYENGPHRSSCGNY